jgi:hypothetical protein
MTPTEIRQALIKIIKEDAFIYEGEYMLEELMPTEKIKELIETIEG